MTTQPVRPFQQIVEERYRALLEDGLQYFVPGAKCEWDNVVSAFQLEDAVQFEWMESTLVVTFPGGTITPHHKRCIASIIRVLTMRFQLVFHPVLAAQSAHLFRGLPEDHYVSAFLDPSSYRDPETSAVRRDRIADAIEALRLSAMSTYENRRISTGLVLAGRDCDVHKDLLKAPAGALPYSGSLTTARSFHHLSDGLRTVALVNAQGLFVGLLDIEQWTMPAREVELPAPVATRYEAHCRSTLLGGHVCLVLTPNGEIKAFANGSQALVFRDGRWRLTDAAECYRNWTEAVGDEFLATRLLTAALNMAEDRRGGLFVILDDLDSLPNLVSSEDVVGELKTDGLTSGDPPINKQAFHYLLRGQTALTLPPAVLETVARIDGAIVLDRKGNILAFGAILQNSIAHKTFAAEGSRTAAAAAASHFGAALKVSEDGLIACYRAGQFAWSL